MQERVRVSALERPDARREFLDALECRRVTGRIPWWEIEFHQWDAFSSRRLILGEEFAALDTVARGEALRENAESFECALDMLPFSAITVPGGYWDWSPGQLAYYVLPDDLRFSQLGAVKDRLGERVALVAHCGGIMCASYDPDFCERLFEAPGEIDREAERLVREGIETAKRLRDLGADAVVCAADIADNSGPFFNPRQMERWILPSAEKWASAVKEMGMKPIMHSDGNLTGYLERLAATGLSALQAVDPVAGMDLSESLSKVRGKMALAGNLDCGLLVSGIPDVIEETAFSMLQAHGSEPGWVFGATNAVQQEAPRENVAAVSRAVNRYWLSYNSQGSPRQPLSLSAQLPPPII